MYVDTKNLTAEALHQQQQQQQQQQQSQQEQQQQPPQIAKSKKRVCKMWKPLLRLITLRSGAVSQQPLPGGGHPNNVHLNNAASMLQHQQHHPEQQQQQQQQQQQDEEIVAPVKPKLELEEEYHYQQLQQQLQQLHYHHYHHHHRHHLQSHHPQQHHQQQQTQQQQQQQHTIVTPPHSMYDALVEWPRCDCTNDDTTTSATITHPAHTPTVISSASIEKPSSHGRSRGSSCGGGGVCAYGRNCRHEHHPLPLPAPGGNDGVADDGNDTHNDAHTCPRVALSHLTVGLPETPPTPPPPMHFMRTDEGTFVFSTAEQQLETELLQAWLTQRNYYNSSNTPSLHRSSGQHHALTLQQQHVALMH